MATSEKHGETYYLQVRDDGIVILGAVQIDGRRTVHDLANGGRFATLRGAIEIAEKAMDHYKVEQTRMYPNTPAWHRRPRIVVRRWSDDTIAWDPGEQRAA